MVGGYMVDNLYGTTTEILIRVAILRTKYKIDSESYEIIASIAELIRLKLKASSPNYREIAELASDINRRLREAKTSSGGGVFL
jgi:hypothetical protein